MNLNRVFHPGDEWIYFKIYIGVKTADEFLIDVVKPLREQLNSEKIISKWFFIRYNDPKNHLRLRFNIKDINNYFYVLNKMNSYFKEYINSGEISTVIIDTYKRELERYGENTIDKAEEFFFKSSELVLNFLEYDDEEKIIVAMYYIESVLSALELTIEEKSNWIKNYNNAFKIEFKADKDLKSKLKKKYLDFYPKYLDFFTSDEYIGIRNLIQKNVTDVELLFEKKIEQENSALLDVKLEDFFQSIFHMHINRLFVSNQRLFEMIIYDYLLKFCKLKKMKVLK